MKRFLLPLTVLSVLLIAAAITLRLFFREGRDASRPGTVQSTIVHPGDEPSDADDRPIATQAIRPQSEGQAEKEQDPVAIRQYARLLAEIQAALQHGRMDEARTLLGKCRIDLRGWEWHHLRTLCSEDRLRLPQALDSCWYAACTPDGRFLATVAGSRIRKIYPSSVDFIKQDLRAPGGDKVRVWDVSRGRLVREIALEEKLPARQIFSPDEAGRNGQYADPERQPIALSPDGRWLAVGVWDDSARKARVQVWDVATGEDRAWTMPPVPDVFLETISALPIAEGEQWDGLTPADEKVWSLHARKKVLAPLVGFSRDSRRLLASGAGCYKVLDVERGTVLWTPETAERFFSGGGQTAVVIPQPKVERGRQLRRLEVRRAATGEELVTVEGSEEGELNKDGTRLLAHVLPTEEAKRSGSLFGLHAVQLWDVLNRRKLAEAVDVHGAAFSPDGQHVALRVGKPHPPFEPAKTYYVRVLDARDGREVGCCRPDFWELGRDAIRFSSDGRWILLSSNNPGQPTLVIWDAAAPRETIRLPGNTVSVGAVAFSADGRWLAVAGAPFWKDNAFGGGTPSKTHVKLWDLTSGKEQGTFQGEESAFTALASSPDGKRLAGFDHEKVAIWDVATCLKLINLHGPTGSGGDLAFSSDSKRLLLSSPGAIPAVWDASDQD